MYLYQNRCGERYVRMRILNGLAQQTSIDMNPCVQCKTSNLKSVSADLPGLQKTILLLVRWVRNGLITLLAARYHHGTLMNTCNWSMIRPNQFPDSENHSPPDIAEITVVSRQKYLNAILRQGKNEACVSVTHDWQAAAVCKRGKQGGRKWPQLCLHRHMGLYY